jgi:hypothetical protein
MRATRDVKEVLTMITNKMEDIKTCFGCEVVSINPLRKDRVSIRLSVKDTADFKFPDVLDVPVKFFKFGKSLIYAPVSVGDKGVVIFSTKSTSQFKNPVNSVYKTFFDIDNAFYIGGCFTDIDNTSILGDNLLIIHGNDKIEMKDEEVDVVSTTVNIKATNINLGDGGAPIARVGDQVTVGASTGTITTGGTATSI